MTPHQKRKLSPITQRMAGDMLVRNLAQRTIDTYTYHVERFSKHFGQPLDQLGPEEIREYQLHLVEVKKASWSQFNQAVCGLRFLYHITVARPWVVQHIPFGKRPKRLPSVLGSDEVSRLIACVPLLKHRTVPLPSLSKRQGSFLFKDKTAEQGTRALAEDIENRYYSGGSGGV